MEKSSESEEFGPRSLKPSKRDWLTLDEMVCFICYKPDKSMSNRTDA